MYLFEYDAEAEKKALAEYYYEIGFQEGCQEGVTIMVKNLLKVKAPMHYIKGATGWSEEKILKLAEEND